jgi:hypothetical protein
MDVKLNCKVTIEQSVKTLSFTALNHCEVKKSIYILGSKAKIKIPASARLIIQGRPTDSVQTAKQFNRGDKISICLGYDNDLQDEFSGFIYRVNFTTPLEIECEGYEFLLRSALNTKTWASTTLKKVVEYICNVKGIILSDEIPDIPFSSYVIKAGLSRLEALQELKENYSLTAYFVENSLYIGLAYTPDMGTVKYTIGVNTIKDDQLKYRYGDDVKLKIKAVGINGDNKRVEVEVGDHDGQVRPLYSFTIHDKETLKKWAQEEIQKYKYSGYDGKITAFLQPYCQPGMKVKLVDPKYNEKSGTFYIVSTKVEFGRSWARRQVEIDIKLG